MRTQNLMLHIELLSDTTFGRGAPTAGVVQTEVEHDENGFPFIGGRTVRGLLRASWLSMQEPLQRRFPELHLAAVHVLGNSGSLEDSCRLRVGDGRVPRAIRDALNNGQANGKPRLSADVTLRGFTEIRSQTAESRSTGAPETTTLRTSRVVLRGFAFEARLTWLHGYQPTAEDLQVLALSALCARHGGLLCNRGRGHLRLTLNGNLDETRKLAGGSR